jgi:trk system potassium uptake protein TrkA
MVNIINGAFSFWQEFKAEKATEALRKLLPSYARALRDGEVQRILAEELVPGDVILLEEGDRISADARLIEENELRVDQSTLSGESHAVRKTSEAVLEENVSRTELPNIVYAGTTIAAGTGSDETNLVVCSLARLEFKVPRVIARVNNPKNAWLYTPEMGVDVALNQADLLAHLIAEEMSLGDMMTLLKLRKGLYSLVEEKVHPDSIANGKTVGDLSLPPRCALAAIIRKGELTIPHGDMVLQPADEILAVIHSDEISQLAAILGPSNPGA